VSFTVVPLHNLDLPAGTCYPIGSKFVIQDVPEWLKQDKGILADISRHDRMTTCDMDAWLRRHAAVAGALYEQGGDVGRLAANSESVGRFIEAVRRLDRAGSATNRRIQTGLR